MIWHFLEVWLLLFIAFGIGCLAGALLYFLLARSPLADVQGMLADAVGDLIDGIKARLGVGPVWRPDHRRNAARSEPEFDAGDGEDFLDDAPPARAEPFARADEARAAPVEAGGNGAAWVEPPPEVDWEGEPLWEEEEAAAEALGLSNGTTAPEALAIEPAKAEPAMRPSVLAAPRNGVPDNLQRIRGIGQKNEELLNGLGIFHFGQIAAWTPAEVRWVAAYLAFPERIERDDWIGQAIILASGGQTGYVKAPSREPDEEVEPATESEPSPP